MLVQSLARLRGVLKATGLLPVVKRLFYAPREGDGVRPDTFSLRYRIKALIEQASFAAVTTVHDLPAIHELGLNATSRRNCVGSVMNRRRTSSLKTCSEHSSHLRIPRCDAPASGPGTAISRSSWQESCFLQADSSPAT